MSRAGGDDEVTDFDLADADGDGRFNDQIDVSDLRTPGGVPVTAWDVTVEDDGFGNALLTFPEGETLVLRGIGPAQMRGAQNLYRAGIPCFTAGTMILTPHGEVPVEQLRPGDRVVTRDNGAKPALWVGQRHLGRADLDRQPALRPVRIAPGGWAGERGLVVSPQHGLLARGTARGGEDMLIRATHLARLKGGKARIAQGVRSVTYVHLMFDAHQVVFSNGVATESFYPGQWGLNSLAQGPLLELLHLFPDLRAAPVEAAYGDPARPYSRMSRLPDRAEALRAEVIMA